LLQCTESDLKKATSANSEKLKPLIQDKDKRFYQYFNYILKKSTTLVFAAFQADKGLNTSYISVIFYSLRPVILHEG
jgi:hypothetical protein